MQQIEILTTFDTNGIPHPFRMRILAEDESLIVINIDKILFREENKREESFKYRCECVFQERRRYVDIYFHKKIMKWYLKM